MTATETVRHTRERLGRVGVWLANPAMHAAPAAVQRREIARIEELGYGSVWTGETPGGKDMYVQLGVLLAATGRIVLGAGIANASARTPATAYGAITTLADAYPDRLIAGFGGGMPKPGVGPLGVLRGYLADLAATPKQAIFPVVEPARPAPIVLAAVGPKMVALSGEIADGAHPFAMPVANTAIARGILGPDKLLIPEQAIAFDPDPAKARDAAHEYRKFTTKAARDFGVDPLRMPYARNLLRLGYTEQDILESSDRLIDDTIAHGDETVIAERVRAHLDAGADHVLVNPLGAGLPAMVDQLAALAPALLG